ncbi:MAG: hypothetical protein U0Q11_22660 [Vicinamibacterales bacterium]
MDTRFCAVCNRTSSSVSSFASAVSGRVDTSLDEILTLLNETTSRATYGAVAGVLGVPPRSMGALLGERRPEASWVVNADTGLPTDYTQADWHPELLSTSSVIRTGNELTLRLTLWRAKR